MPDIAYVNGRVMPIARARVSVEDRGFQFGDGIYEVIRTYGGKVFRVDAHLARLEASAAAIGLTAVYPRSRWKAILTRMNEKCGYKNAKLYLQITRGVAPRDHALSRGIPPTVVVTARRMTVPPAELYRRGAAVISVPDHRWGRCDVKTVNLLPNVMARQKARAEGVQDAIFIRDGHVTEGATSNLFAVIRGRLVTPPLGPEILSGITRDCVISLAKGLAVPVEQRELLVKELRAADEVLLCGTTIEILPVVQVDGRAVGKGRPGPIGHALLKEFQELTRR
jgi:D-alanine transaminase